MSLFIVLLILGLAVGVTLAFVEAKGHFKHIERKLVEQVRPEPCGFERGALCRHQHMQVEQVRLGQPNLVPEDLRRDHVHIFDKITGNYVGARAVGHSDTSPERYKVFWPNGEEVT